MRWDLESFVVVDQVWYDEVVVVEAAMDLDDVETGLLVVEVDGDDVKRQELPAVVA